MLFSAQSLLPKPQVRSISQDRLPIALDPRAHPPGPSSIERNDAMPRPNSMHRVASILICALKLATAVELAHAESHGEHTRAIQTFRESELAAREHLVATAPLYHWTGGTTEIVLFNRSWRRISVTIDLIEDGGAARPLTELSVSPKRHVTKRVDLRDLARLPVAVRLRYFDLPSSIQGFVQHDSLGGANGLFSQPFKLSQNWGTQVFHWPSPGGAYPEDRLEARLTNSSDKPVRFLIARNQESTKSRLEPWASRTIRLGRSSGLTLVEQTSAAGSLIAHGLFIQGPAAIRLPGIDLGEAKNTNEISTIHIPSSHSSRPTKLTVSIGNLSPEPRKVPVALIDSRSGTIRAADSVSVSGHSARAFSLNKLWPQVQSWSSSRLVIGPEPGGLFAFGFVSFANGHLTELAFFSPRSAHNSGSYPLFDTKTHKTVLHLTNLGRETSTVGIEASSTDGTYTLEPLHIRPSESQSFDVSEQLNSSKTADPSGRLPPQRVQNGFLKWLVIAGSGDLLARTEIQAIGSPDRIGINCFGCCWEFPTGVILPGDVTLTSPGVGTQFETAVRFDTCSGTEGPFAFTEGTLSYPAPYSWDGMLVSASSGSAEMLGFFGNAQGTGPSCSPTNHAVSAQNMADACDVWKTSTHCTDNKCDFSNPCDTQTTTCNGCLTCCQKGKAFNECKKKAQHIIQSEFTACQGVCANTLCGA